jgi:arsenate reductase
MNEVLIYHNPRCSKSRATLELLRARGVTPHVVHYLETPPSVAELNRLLQLLDLEPRGLMRTGEDVYVELGLHRVDDRDALIDAMHAHPVLIERPIVVVNRIARDGRAAQKAAIGRPPERVLEIL